MAQSGLLYNGRGHERPGECAGPEREGKCKIAMSRRDGRDRLPAEGGESRRPSWKIKGRQTCLCDHESVILQHFRRRIWLERAPGVRVEASSTRAEFRLMCCRSATLTRITRPLWGLIAPSHARQFYQWKRSGPQSVTVFTPGLRSPW